jgi:hypothetical protein
VAGASSFDLRTSLRLPGRFDVERLRAEVDGIQDVPFTSLRAESHTGAWGGVSLVAQNGKSDVLDCGSDPYRPTEVLQRCPYIRGVLEGFACSKQSVRILTLYPGARIFEHYDPDSSLDRGVVRLHVPIVTHAGVKFVIAGRRVHWPPGELWYGDFSFPHWAHNRSATPRAHLVMDLVVNDAIRALFPADYAETSHLRRAYRAAQCFLCDQRTQLKEGMKRWLSTAGH